MKRLLFFASVLGLAFSLAATAQVNPRFTDPERAGKVRATAAAVEAMYRDYVDGRHMPGFVYGVVLDGELVYSGGFGETNLEQGFPVSSESLFRIASMSKSFTALAILQLRDAGKLDLDDPASKYIPEMEQLDYPTSDSPAITIRHLLTHGAGFPEDNPWGDRQLADSDRELLRLVAEGISFSNAPGVAYEYSNLGFALLGQIVQRVSGMEFTEYTREHVFEPLGMDATVWEYTNAPPERLALGYDWIDEAYVPVPLEHHGSFGAMGGLITSIEDLSKYVALHLSAWPPRDGDDPGPLRRSSLREMHHPWRFASLGTRTAGRDCASVRAYAYGLAWGRDCDGRVTVGHSGGLPGFGSNWTIMPDYGLGVMAFDNRTYGGTSSINAAVLDSIVAMAGLEPRVLPVSSILDRRKDQIVAILPGWEGAEASGLFAENFFMDHRLKDLVERTRELFEEAGEITGVGPLEPENLLRGSFRLDGRLKDLVIFFTLTPEREPLVQQLAIRAVERGR